MTTPIVPRSTRLDVVGRLDDRVLVQTSSRLPSGSGDTLAVQHGMVLTGSKAAGLAKRLSTQLPESTLLYDGESYRERDATRHEPFAIPEGGLFGQMSLGQALDEQRTMGASLALSPTGHIAVGEVDLIEAVVRATTRLNRSDLLVHLPLDARWLTDPGFAGLLAAVGAISHPVAISLAANQNPLSTIGAAESLQRLAALDVPIVLLRTDLAGVDFVVRGGLSASIGATSTLRHGLSPALRGKKMNVRDKRTNVLVPGYLRYMRPQRIAEVFSIAPSCPCSVCRDRRIDRFTRDTASQSLARAHNLAVVEDTLSTINEAGPANRLREWRRLILSAIVQHETHLERGHQTEIATPPEFAVWAY